MSVFDFFLFLLWARVCYGVAAPDPFFVDTFNLWRLGIATLLERIKR